MGKTTMLKELGEIKTDVAVFKEKFHNVEKILKNIEKAISGNGQPGLVQNLAGTEDKLENHIIADTKWKGQKDGSISGMKWLIGIGFSVVGVGIVLLTFI